MKLMLGKYRQTNNTIKAVTLHLLKNIKNSFHKFLKADYMHKLIRDESPEMITIQLLKRTKNTLEEIISGEMIGDALVV